MEKINEKGGGTMGIINLFFIPAISVYILYKLKKSTLVFSADLVLTYMIHCSVVTVVTKFLLLCAEYLFSFPHKEITSAYYSVAALVVSLIVPFVAKIFTVTGKEN